MASRSSGPVPAAATPVPPAAIVPPTPTLPAPVSSAPDPVPATPLATPAPRERGFFDITDETLNTATAPTAAPPTGKRRRFGKTPTAATPEEVAAAMAARDRGPKDLAASVAVPPSSLDLPGGGVGVPGGRARTGGGVVGGLSADQVIPADGNDLAGSGGGGGSGVGNLSGAWQGGSDPTVETVDPEEDARKQKKLLALLAVLGLLLVAMGGWFFLGGDDEEIAATQSPTTTVAGATTTVAGAAAVTTTTVAPGATPGASPPASVNSGLGVKFTPDGALLTGTVRTEDVKQQVIGGATLLFQPGLVEGAELAVEAAAPEVNPNEDAIVRSLGEPVMQGVGAIGVTLQRTDAPGIVVVGGTVRSQVAKDRIVGAIVGVAGGLDKVVDNLTVDPNASPASPAPTAAPPTQGQTTTTAGAAIPTTPGATAAPTPGPAPTPPAAPAPAPPVTPEAAAVQQALDALLASKVIEFPSGSTSLTQQWVNAVNDVAAALTGNAAKVQITGHTDSRGDPLVNLRLSLTRAESIKAALVERGIAADRLTTTGYGAERPIADNNTDAGRQRNRRIEFVVAAR